MCGIIGIISARPRALIPKAIRSLCDLEYRGYDSAGIGFIANKKIITYKVLGAPSSALRSHDVYRKTRIVSHKIFGIIGHNRWATHGKPSLRNAHPHQDCTKRFAVVHNGTILNYTQLKNELKKSGHRFVSDTDTEVIPHLIEQYVGHGMSTPKAVIQAVRRLEGSFALVAIDAHNPHQMFAFKKGSPLVIGETNDTFIIASSTHALVRYTTEYITLDDNEFATVTVGGPRTECAIHALEHDAPTLLAHKEVRHITANAAADMSKGHFDTYMRKEIFEQPATIRSTISPHYDRKHGTVHLPIGEPVERVLPQLRHIHIVGCGTAYHAGMAARYAMETLASLSVQTDIASEFKYLPLSLPREQTLIIAISQSGETADTIEAVKHAKEHGYLTVGVVNVPNSTVAQLADATLYTQAGIEIGVASTKAFTAQVSLLYLLALKCALAQGVTHQEIKPFLRELEAVPTHIKSALHADKIIKTAAKKFSHMKNIMFLGRTFHVPLAYEGALKFKELTYREAGGYPLGELKHGPIAIIDNTTLAVVLMPKDRLFAQSHSNIEQIRSKGGRVLLITSENNRGHPITREADAAVFLPTLTHDILYSILEAVPLQLFAYHMATLMGHNVDKPRNLAKSVTVE